jgi:phosphoserine phosphatase
MKPGADSAVALCIDCDGTLLQTDLLHEGVLAMIKQSPWAVLLLPWWLLRGKAYLKERISERVRFDWESMPYCAGILDLIRTARAQGRRVVLATASPYTPWVV